MAMTSPTLGNFSLRKGQLVHSKIGREKRGKKLFDER